MSNGQGVGLKSQSLSFYNRCNLDKSKIKVDFLRKIDYLDLAHKAKYPISSTNPKSCIREAIE